MKLWTFAKIVTLKTSVEPQIYLLAKGMILSLKVIVTNKIVALSRNGGVRLEEMPV